MAELSGKWTLNKKLIEPSSEIKQSFLVTLGSGQLCSYVRITNNKLNSSTSSAYGTVIDATWGGLGSGQGTGIAGYIYSDRQGWAESKPEFQIWDFGTTPQYVSDEFYTYFTENAKQNLQIDIETNGTISLMVQDKQCDRAIDINVDIPTSTSEEKTVTPTKEAQTITPTNADFLSKVIVEAIPDEYIIPEGELTIDRNNKTYDVTEYATIKVNTANPYEVSSESFMNALVNELVGSTIGGVYKYVGTTTDTYENGALYILEEVS